eukprot:Ihof_evm11s129 gene=Ihof_evmTU11s129
MEELLVDETGSEIHSLNPELFNLKVGKYLSNKWVNSWGLLATTLHGSIGFDGLAAQVQKNVRQNGVEFNIMLVGSSGLGKSTIINTLFRADLSPTNQTSKLTRDTTELEKTTHVLEENGLFLKLSVIESPGFGNQLNNTGAWEPMVNYIKTQYQKYLDSEISPNRKRHIPDTRVHVVLYFVPPTGHSLRAIDIASLKAFGQVANVILVIPKADALTPEERAGFKKRVMEDVKFKNIHIFPLVKADNWETEAHHIEDSKWLARMPLAVMGSDDVSSTPLVRKTHLGVIE